MKLGSIISKPFLLRHREYDQRNVEWNQFSHLHNLQGHLSITYTQNQRILAPNPFLNFTKAVSFSSSMKQKLLNIYNVYLIHMCGFFHYTWKPLLLLVTLYPLLPYSPWSVTNSLMLSLIFFYPTSNPTQKTSPPFLCPYETMDSNHNQLKESAPVVKCVASGDKHEWTHSASLVVLYMDHKGSNTVTLYQALCFFVGR